MEQQNQQPLQQEQPNSPSIRKSFVNPKLPLVIALVATTLTVGGILLLKTFQSSPTLPSAPASTQLTTGEEVKTQGVVKANNQGCEIDADCFIVLKEPETDKEIRVIYQPGWTVCADRDVLPNSNPYTIQVGDEVEVYGKVTSENFISICESSAYYIRRLKKESDVDTSTWQTYRNDEFGFEVRYPTFYEVLFEYKEPNPDMIFGVAFEAKQEYIDKYESWSIGIFKGKAQKGVGLDELGESITSDVCEQVPSLVSNSIPALRCMQEGDTGQGDVGFYPRQFYFLSPSLRFFQVHYLHLDKYENESLIKQILSTFRFIE